MTTTPRTIYLAGPMTPKGQRSEAPNPAIEYLMNLADLISAANALIDKGYAPYCPALDFLYFLTRTGKPISEARIKSVSMAFLEACDCAVFIPRWESSIGANEEYGRAVELEMPIFFGVENVPDLSEEVEDEHNNRDALPLADSGKRMDFPSGAMREPASGKGRFDLLSPFANRRTALVMEKGALKYAARNWEMGMPFSRFVDSAMRHLNQYLMGMRDEDHLAQARFNIDALMHFEETGRKDLDDLPHYERKGERWTAKRRFKRYAKSFRGGRSMRGFHPKWDWPLFLFWLRNTRAEAIGWQKPRPNSRPAGQTEMPLSQSGGLSSMRPRTRSGLTACIRIMT